MVVYKALNTKIESLLADGGHAVGDGHGGEAGAVTESFVPDGSYAVAYGHGGEATATIESRAADGGDTVAYGHGGEGCAIVVFASHFISTTCMLNGRKVIT